MRCFVLTRARTKNTLHKHTSTSTSTHIGGRTYCIQWVSECMAFTNCSRLHACDSNVIMRTARAVEWRICVYFESQTHRAGWRRFRRFRRCVFTWVPLPMNFKTRRICMWVDDAATCVYNVGPWWVITITHSPILCRHMFEFDWWRWRSSAE